MEEDSALKHITILMAFLGLVIGILFLSFSALKGGPTGAPVLPQVICGDGIFDVGLEGCDDGNLVNGDGCSAFCEIESCNNGALNGPPEFCDETAGVAPADGCLFGEACLRIGVTACSRCCPDGDGDQFCFLEDCNDANPGINPGAPELCDGVDNNCVGGVDEGFDGDFDGFTTCGGDCNDANAAVNPAAPEVCNAIDDNCNGPVDEGFDVDGDTFTTCAGDCNDGNPLINPAAPEVCDGVDNNCNGPVDEGGVCVPVCGNGITEGGEACDDGNVADCDGCSSTCRTEVCGNGVTECAEGCDDGNLANGDGCSSTCTVEPPPFCGNGIVEGPEQCDDANLNLCDGCDGITCRFTCGNGIIDVLCGEQCDPPTALTCPGGAACLGGCTCPAPPAVSRGKGGGGGGTNFYLRVDEFGFYKDGVRYTVPAPIFDRLLEIDGRFIGFWLKGQIVDATGRPIKLQATGELRLGGQEYSFRADLNGRVDFDNPKVLAPFDENDYGIEKPFSSLPQFYRQIPDRKSATYRSSTPPFQALPQMSFSGQGDLNVKDKSGQPVSGPYFGEITPIITVPAPVATAPPRPTPTPTPIPLGCPPPLIESKDACEGKPNDRGEYVTEQKDTSGWPPSGCKIVTKCTEVETYPAAGGEQVGTVAAEKKCCCKTEKKCDQWCPPGYPIVRVDCPIDVAPMGLPFSMLDGSECVWAAPAGGPGEAVGTVSAICCCKEKIPCPPKEVGDKHKPLKLEEPFMIVGTEKEEPQPPKFHPLITEVKNDGDNNFAEVTNAGEKPINLDGYFLLFGSAPADKGSTQLIGFFPPGITLNVMESYAVYESDWRSGNAKYYGGSEPNLIPEGGYVTLYEGGAGKSKEAKPADKGKESKETGGKITGKAVLDVAEASAAVAEISAKYPADKSLPKVARELSAKRSGNCKGVPGFVAIDGSPYMLVEQIDPARLQQAQEYLGRGIDACQSVASDASVSSMKSAVENKDCAKELEKQLNSLFGDIGTFSLANAPVGASLKSDDVNVVCRQSGAPEFSFNPNVVALDDGTVWKVAEVPGDLQKCVKGAKPKTAASGLNTQLSFMLADNLGSVAQPLAESKEPIVTSKPPVIPPRARAQLKVADVIVVPDVEDKTWYRLPEGAREGVESDDGVFSLVNHDEGSENLDETFALGSIPPSPYQPAPATFWQKVKDLFAKREGHLIITQVKAAEPGFVTVYNADDHHIRTQTYQLVFAEKQGNRAKVDWKASFPDVVLAPGESYTFALKDWRRFQREYNKLPDAVIAEVNGNEVALAPLLLGKAEIKSAGVMAIMATDRGVVDIEQVGITGSAVLSETEILANVAPRSKHVNVDKLEEIESSKAPTKIPECAAIPEDTELVELDGEMMSVVEILMSEDDFDALIARVNKVLENGLDACSAEISNAELPDDLIAGAKHLNDQFESCLQGYIAEANMQLGKLGKVRAEGLEIEAQAKGLDCTISQGKGGLSIDIDDDPIVVIDSNLVRVKPVPEEWKPCGAPGSDGDLVLSGKVVDIKPYGAPGGQSGQMICDRKEDKEEEKPTPDSAGFNKEESEPWGKTWFIAGPTPWSWCGGSAGGAGSGAVSAGRRAPGVSEMSDEDMRRELGRSEAAVELEKQLPNTQQFGHAPVSQGVPNTQQFGHAPMQKGESGAPAGNKLTGSFITGAEIYGFTKIGAVDANDFLQNMFDNAKRKDRNEVEAVNVFKAKEFNPTYGAAVAEQAWCPYYVMREPTQPMKAKADSEVKTAQTYMSDLNAFTDNELHILAAAIKWAVTGKSPTEEAQEMSGDKAQAALDKYKDLKKKADTAKAGAAKDAAVKELQGFLAGEGAFIQGMADGMQLAGYQTELAEGPPPPGLQGQALENWQNEKKAAIAGLEAKGATPFGEGTSQELKDAAKKLSSGQMSPEEFQKIFEKYKQKAIEEAQKLEKDILETDFPMQARMFVSEIEQIRNRGEGEAGYSDYLVVEISKIRPCRIPASVAMVPLAPPIATYIHGLAQDIETARLAAYEASVELAKMMAEPSSNPRSYASLLKVLDVYDKYVIALVLIEKIHYKQVELLDLLEHQMRVDWPNEDCCKICPQDEPGYFTPIQKTVTEKQRQKPPKLPVPQAGETGANIPESPTTTITVQGGTTKGGTKDPCDGVTVAEGVEKNKFVSGGKLIAKTGDVDLNKLEVNRKLAQGHLLDAISACKVVADKKAADAKKNIFEQFPMPGEGYLAGSGENQYLKDMNSKLRQNGIAAALNNINAEFDACVKKAVDAENANPGLQASASGGKISFKDGKIEQEPVSYGVGTSYYKTGDGKAVAGKEIPTNAVDCVKTRQVRNKVNDLSTQADNLRKSLDDAQKKYDSLTDDQKKQPCDKIDYKIKVDDKGNVVAYKPAIRSCEDELKKQENIIGLDKSSLESQVKSLVKDASIDWDKGAVKDLTEAGFANAAVGQGGKDAEQKAYEAYAAVRKFAPQLKAVAAAKAECEKKSPEERQGKPEEVVTPAANDPCFTKQKLAALTGTLASTLAAKSALSSTLPEKTNSQIVDETTSTLKELAKLVGITEPDMTKATTIKNIVNSVAQKFGVDVSEIAKAYGSAQLTIAKNDLESKIAYYERIAEKRALSHEEWEDLAQARVTLFSLNEPTDSGVQFERRIKNLFKTLAYDQGKTEEEIEELMKTVQGRDSILSTAKLNDATKTILHVLYEKTIDKTKFVEEFIKRYVPKETRDRLEKEGLTIVIDEQTGNFKYQGFRKLGTTSAEINDQYVDILNLKFAGWHLRKDTAIAQQPLTPAQASEYENVFSVEKWVEKSAVEHARDGKTDIWRVLDTAYLDVLEGLDPTFVSELRETVAEIASEEFRSKITERNNYKSRADASFIEGKSKRGTALREAELILDSQLETIAQIRCWANPELCSSIIERVGADVRSHFDDVKKGLRSTNDALQSLVKLQRLVETQYLRSLRYKLEKEGKSYEDIVKTVTSEETRWKARSTAVLRASGILKTIRDAITLAKSEGREDFAASVQAYDKLTTGYLTYLESELKSKPTTDAGQIAWLSTWATVVGMVKESHRLLEGEYYTVTPEGIRIPRYGISKWAVGFHKYAYELGLTSSSPTEVFDLEMEYLAKLENAINRFTSAQGSTIEEKFAFLKQTDSGKQTLATLLSLGVLGQDYKTINMNDQILNEFDSRDTYKESKVDNVINFDRLIDLEIMLASATGAGALTRSLQLGSFASFVVEGFFFHEMNNVIRSGAESLADNKNFLTTLGQQDHSFKAFASSYAFLGLSRIIPTKGLQEALKDSLLGTATLKLTSAAAEAFLFTQVSYVMEGMPEDYDYGTHYANSLVDMLVFKSTGEKNVKNPRLEYKSKLAEKSSIEVAAEAAKLSEMRDKIQSQWEKSELSTPAAEKQMLDTMQKYADTLSVLVGKYAKAKDTAQYKATLAELREAREAELALGTRRLNPSSDTFAVNNARLNMLRTRLTFETNPSKANFESMMAARETLVKEMTALLDKMYQKGEVDAAAYAVLKAKLDTQVRTNAALRKLTPFMLDALQGKATEAQAKEFNIEDVFKEIDLPEEVKAPLKEEVQAIKDAVEKKPAEVEIETKVRPKPAEEKPSAVGKVPTISEESINKGAKSEYVGEGIQGRVFRLTYPDGTVKIAKTFKSPDDRTAFETEVEKLSKLKGVKGVPQIEAVYETSYVDEFGRVGRVPGILMSEAKGKTLAELRKEGASIPKEVLEAAESIIRTAHDKGVANEDLKLDDVFWNGKTGAEMEVTVTDWGLKLDKTFADKVALDMAALERMRPVEKPVLAEEYPTKIAEDSFYKRETPTTDVVKAEWQKLKADTSSAAKSARESLEKYVKDLLAEENKNLLDKIEDKAKREEVLNNIFKTQGEERIAKLIESAESTAGVKTQKVDGIETANINSPREQLEGKGFGGDLNVRKTVTDSQGNTLVAEVNGDIKGEGFRASVLKSIVIDTINKAPPGSFENPVELIKLIEGAVRKYFPIGDWTTFSVVVTNPAKSTAKIATAGEPVLVFKAATGEVQVIQTISTTTHTPLLTIAGLPKTLLAKVKPIEAAATEVKLENGDVIVQLTDGVTEQRRTYEKEGKETFDEYDDLFVQTQPGTVDVNPNSKLVKLIKDGISKGESAEKILDGILKDERDWAKEKNADRLDDFTLKITKVEKTPVAEEYPARTEQKEKPAESMPETKSIDQLILEIESEKVFEDKKRTLFIPKNAEAFESRLKDLEARMREADELFAQGKFAEASDKYRSLSSSLDSVTYEMIRKGLIKDFSPVENYYKGIKTIYDGRMSIADNIRKGSGESLEGILENVPNIPGSKATDVVPSVKIKRLLGEGAQKVTFEAEVTWPDGSKSTMAAKFFKESPLGLQSFYEEYLPHYEKDRAGEKKLQPGKWEQSDQALGVKPKKRWAGKIGETHVVIDELAKGAEPDNLNPEKVRENYDEVRQKVLDLARKYVESGIVIIDLHSQNIFIDIDESRPQGSRVTVTPIDVGEMRRVLPENIPVAVEFFELWVKGDVESSRYKEIVKQFDKEVIRYKDALRSGGNPELYNAQLVRLMLIGPYSVEGILDIIKQKESIAEKPVLQEEYTGKIVPEVEKKTVPEENSVITGKFSMDFVKENKASVVLIALAVLIVVAVLVSYRRRPPTVEDLESGVERLKNRLS